MKIIKMIKILPVTILFIIYIICMISVFVWTVYTSDGKWTYNKYGEVYFTDKDGVVVKEKNVKYQDKMFYVDKYGQRVLDNNFYKDILK